VVRIPDLAADYIFDGLRWSLFFGGLIDFRSRETHLIYSLWRADRLIFPKC